MAGFNITEWISRTPKEVFDFIVDSENASRIVPSVKSMSRLTEGPVRAGTRYRETRLMNGREQHAELEVVAYEPDQKYAMKNITEGIESVYQYNLHPEGNGTRVNLACEVKAGGLKKLMLPMVASILKKEDGDHLREVEEGYGERIIKVHAAMIEELFSTSGEQEVGGINLSCPSHINQCVNS